MGHPTVDTDPAVTHTPDLTAAVIRPDAVLYRFDCPTCRAYGDYAVWPAATRITCRGCRRMWWVPILRMMYNCPLVPLMSGGVAAPRTLNDLAREIGERAAKAARQAHDLYTRGVQ